MKPNPNRHRSGARPIASTLGGRIRFERQAKGWTLEQLASASGSTPDAIARIEAAESAPSEADVERIAAALGLSVDQLAFYFAPSESVTKPGIG